MTLPDALDVSGTLPKTASGEKQFTRENEGFVLHQDV